jgi:hypothetical protein
MDYTGMPMDLSRRFLRHTVAVLAYRAAKVLRDAPASFGTYSRSDGGRLPVQTLAHMGDLFDWALSMAEGHEVWVNAAPLEWPAEIARFFDALQRFDDYLASDLPLGRTTEELFAGPVADALIHTGQLSLLRRMAGHPVKGENYSRAQIEIGFLSLDQAVADYEFD